MSDDRFIKEAERLKISPPEGIRPGGMGTVQFTADCSESGTLVLARVKEVMQIVSKRMLTDWPSDQQWKLILPGWFLSACAPPKTKEEAEEWMMWWRSLPQEKQVPIEQEKEWSLEGWLYWMKPENRVWTWWDARAIDANTVIVAIEVTNWPFPWGALSWLFRAAGSRQLV